MTVAPNVAVETWEQINKPWGQGVVIGSYSDYVSIKITSLIKGPITGTVTFRMVSDDGSSLIISKDSFDSKFFRWTNHNKQLFDWRVFQSDVRAAYFLT